MRLPLLPEVLVLAKMLGGSRQDESRVMSAMIAWREAFAPARQ
jgi:hypothetical protein